MRLRMRGFLAVAGALLAAYLLAASSWCAAPALQLAIFAHHLPMGDTASYVAVGATVQ